MQINLIDLQKMLQANGILISFSGRFSQEIIEELGDAVKKYLETESISQKETYNVFSVFIEQTQNIKNYSAGKNGSKLGERVANSGIVTIGKSNGRHFVSSGNIVESADAQALQDHLELIRCLDQAGLKKLYKEQMKKDIVDESNGAGLGLIDMARKASQPLEYSISQLDEQAHFFTLKVNI